MTQQAHSIQFGLCTNCEMLHVRLLDDTDHCFAEAVASRELVMEMIEVGMKYLDGNLIPDIKQ